MAWGNTLGGTHNQNMISGVGNGNRLEVVDTDDDNNPALKTTNTGDD